MKLPTSHPKTWHSIKASIKEQNIFFKDVLKIRMFNNLGPEFKTYLTVVNDRMQKDKKLEKDKVLFKAIEEKET